MDSSESEEFGMIAGGAFSMAERQVGTEAYQAGVEANKAHSFVLNSQGVHNHMVTETMKATMELKSRLFSLLILATFPFYLLALIWVFKLVIL